MRMFGEGAEGRAGRRVLGAVTAVLAVHGLAAGPLVAQTDYYNLDKDRPLRVEDAYAAERYAFELQVSPLTLAERRRGARAYTASLELKYGIAPGAEVSVGIAPTVERWGEEAAGTSAELELSALYNLNVETLTWPALGVRVTGHVPVDAADHGSSVEVRGIATRTVGGPVRAHVNAAAVLGDGDARWWAGAALDHVLPFQAMLWLAEVYVADDRAGGVVVGSSLGLRYQLTTTLGVDVGFGRDWTGNAGDAWRATMGLTSDFGLRALMPRRSRWIGGD